MDAYNSSSPVVTNCTFSGNSATTYGGGMYIELSSPKLTNCILWGDSQDEIVEDTSSPTVTYSDIQGGYSGDGNINADPLFVDADNGDFHLTADSPCIDAGTNTAPDLPTLDFEGDARVIDGDGDGTATVDMGVDEAWGPPPAIIYVDQDATGAHDGTSWKDALTDLQHALTWAVDGVEIRVAAGTYTPTQELSPGDPRSAAFQMKNGVAMYGGFDPTVGDIAFADRDWVASPTVLSGDLDGNDLTGPYGVITDTANITGTNSYHVFYHPAGTNLDGSAVLDGFTITGGNANGDSYPDNAGGGMYNDSSSPAVIHCTFSGNSALSGGGMANLLLLLAGAERLHLYR